MCWTVGPSLAASCTFGSSLKGNQLKSFDGYYFGVCSFGLSKLIPLPNSHWRSTHYSNRLHDFSITIPRCNQDIYVNRFLPSTARLSNSLSAECFPLNHDLNVFRSTVNGLLFSLVLSKQLSYMFFILFFILFL